MAVLPNFSLVIIQDPTIWKFIQALKIEQTKNDVFVKQSIAASFSLKKYRDCAQHITDIVAQYEQTDIVDCPGNCMLKNWHSKYMSPRKNVLRLIARD